MKLSSSVVVLALVLLFPAEAWLSGAYWNRFLEDRFSYTVDDQVRKRYVDPGDARRAFEERDVAVKSRFLVSIPRLEASLSKWEKKGIGILPRDPFSSAVLVSDAAGILALRSHPLPVTVRLNISKKPDRTLEHIELTLGAYPDPELLLAFQADLKEQIVPEEAAPAGREQAADSLRLQFAKPLAELRFGEYFGVYLGILSEVRERTGKRVRVDLARELDRIFPSLERSLSDPGKIKDAGLSGARPVKEVLRKRGGDPVEHFNPYGPLYDDLARESVDVGLTSTILLFAPKEVDATGERPDQSLLAWVRDLLRQRVPARAGPLVIEVRLAKEVVTSAADLEFHVTLTNRSEAALRVNTLMLGHASLVLRVEDARGNPVLGGPPPVPHEDSKAPPGVELAAGASCEYVYRGGDYFASALAPGRYRVQARYGNASATRPGEWTGTLESGWGKFTVKAKTP